MNIKNVELFPLRQISDQRGKVMHFLKKTDPYFVGFGESYFSVVNPGVVKGWKLHKEAIQSIVVVSGKMKFVLIEGERLDQVTLSPDSNYQLLRIPSNVYYSFKCESEEPAVLANISTLAHDPNESINLDINHFKHLYDWN